MIRTSKGVFPLMILYFGNNIMKDNKRLVRLASKRQKLKREIIKIEKEIESQNPHKQKTETKKNLQILKELIPDFDEVCKELIPDEKEIPTDDLDAFMEYFSNNPSEWDSLIDRLREMEK